MCNRTTSNTGANSQSSDTTRSSVLRKIPQGRPSTTLISTLSLHAALPILAAPPAQPASARHAAMAAYLVIAPAPPRAARAAATRDGARRSEEHTSELQSHVNLVCRPLPEKKMIDGNIFGQNVQQDNIKHWG